jgi:hypothetical protein
MAVGVNVKARFNTPANGYKTHRFIRVERQKRGFCVILANASGYIEIKAYTR